MKKTSQKAQKLEERSIDLENKLKRALADYANLEKRWEKEREEFLKFSNAQLLRKILEILDELQLCECYLNDKGLALVCDKLRELLKSESIQRISALGEEFDPQTMEAVEMIAGPKNKVIDVVRDGYRFGGKILRPAKVKVGNGIIKK